MNITANHSLHSLKATKEQKENVFLDSLKHAVTLILAFAYVTLPIWGAWLADFYQLHIVSSQDLLLAICWMPACAAIIYLSFIKTRLHPAVALAIFVTLNALAISAAWYLDLLPF